MLDNIPDGSNIQKTLDWFKLKSILWSQVLAARAALRALPLIKIPVDFAIKNDLKHVHALRLMPFRCCAIALIVPIAPKDAIPWQFTADARVAKTVEDYSVSPLAYACCDAADAASAFADIDGRYSAAAALARTMAATLNAAGVYNEAFTKAFIEDCNSLMSNMSAQSLALTPLWNISIPDKVGQMWIDYKNDLLSLQIGYEVWINWYENRLHGEPYSIEKEIWRVLIREDEWKMGAKHVNMILKLIEYHKH